MSHGETSATTRLFCHPVGSHRRFRHARRRRPARRRHIPGRQPATTALTRTTPRTITPQYPAASPNVVAVGGTTLTVSGSNPNYTYGERDGLGQWRQQRDDGGGGGGISAYESQPAYQNGVVNAFSTTQRTYPDVSADANPNSGVPIYDSYDYGSFDPLDPRLYGRHQPGLPAVGGHHRRRRRRPSDRRAGIARRPQPDPAGTLQAAGRRLPRHHHRQQRPRPCTAGPGYDLATRHRQPRRQSAHPGIGQCRYSARGDERQPGDGRPRRAVRSVTITGTDFSGVTWWTSARPRQPTCQSTRRRRSRPPARRNRPARWT